MEERMAVSEKSALFAIRNIARYGDTDVFPFPLENHWFHDADEDVAKLLLELDKNFDEWLRTYPVNFTTGLSSVGYNGFRAATQIDPIWNAYLLALLFEIGEEIESARIGVGRGLIFSYRFKPSIEDNSLFDRSIGWFLFHKTALEYAALYEVVVSTDISDFYPRVYHHRLENALMKASSSSEIVRRIMAILGRLSGGPSYGLPVGGQASRMLAELLLNRTDRLLIAAGIPFCRFVDDYLLFAKSAGLAQSILVQLVVRYF